MHFPIRTSPSTDAVPSGRIPYDIHAPALLRHIVQSEEAFDELCSTGRIVPNPAPAAPGKEEAYSWLYRRLGIQFVVKYCAARRFTTSVVTFSMRWLSIHC